MDSYVYLRYFTDLYVFCTAFYGFVRYFVRLFVRVRRAVFVRIHIRTRRTVCPPLVSVHA